MRSTWATPSMTGTASTVRRASASVWTARPGSSARRRAGPARDGSPPGRWGSSAGRARACSTRSPRSARGSAGTSGRRARRAAAARSPAGPSRSATPLDPAHPEAHDRPVAGLGERVAPVGVDARGDTGLHMHRAVALGADLRQVLGLHDGLRVVGVPRARRLGREIAARHRQPAAGRRAGEQEALDELGRGHPGRGGSGWYWISSRSWAASTSSPGRTVSPTDRPHALSAPTPPAPSARRRTARRGRPGRSTGSRGPLRSSPDAARGPPPSPWG